MHTEKYSLDISKHPSINWPDGIHNMAYSEWLDILIWHDLDRLETAEGSSGNEVNKKTPQHLTH